MDINVSQKCMVIFSGKPKKAVQYNTIQYSLNNAWQNASYAMILWQWINEE